MNVKNKISALLAVLFILFSICSCSKKVEKSVFLDEADTIVEMPIRVIVLVVDISKSITNQIDEIVDVLNDEIIENLNGGDHCVIVPIGDAVNVEKARRFSITSDFEKSDKNSIKEYLYLMKNWLETNHNTDIGAAMKKTFEFLSDIEKEVNSNDKKRRLDSLVLFITDGEIYPSKKDRSEFSYLEKIKYDSLDAIFSDPMMTPVNSDYSNWWFLGIENDGNHRVDIQNIAEVVGAFPGRYTTLSDMSKFKEKFKEWISTIDSIKTKDNGRIVFSNVKLGDCMLSSDSTNYTVVPNNSDLFTWLMKSEYKNKSVVMNFKDVHGTFQKNDSGESIKFQLVPEAGNIEFSPGAVRETRANVKLSDITGKGRLKLTINTVLNANNDGQIPEYLFYVEFKTPFAIFFHKILPLLIIAIGLILLIVIIKILKAIKPVRIKLDSGKSKASITVMRIHETVEFGRKTDLELRLEGESVPLVIGTITRTGARKYKIVSRDEKMFKDQSINPYELGTSLKLSLKDGCTRTIRFVEER